MPRDYTYSTVESYIADILGVHDSRLQNQLNAANNVQDCGYQMSALAAMRTMAPLFFSRDFHRGAFVFTLTDLHQSNIFVDDEWRITCLVDLEWACSRPIQVVEPPYWSTNKGVDEIDVGEYDKLRKGLLTVMNAEEAEKSRSFLSKDARKTRYDCRSPTGLFSLFYDYIPPLLFKNGSEEIGEIMPFYWGKDVGKSVATKLADKKKYDRELRQAFTASSSDEN